MDTYCPGCKVKTPTLDPVIVQTPTKRGSIRRQTGKCGKNPKHKKSTILPKLKKEGDESVVKKQKTEEKELTT